MLPPSTTSTSTSISTLTITNQASIQVYNRGPITSVFTAPTSCLSTLTFGEDMYFGHRYNTGYFDPSCFPTSTTDRGAAGWGIYYYSPAQCPLGWAHATTLSNAIGRGQTILSIGVDTTAVVCCPSGYNYDGDGHSCKSVIVSKTTQLAYIQPVLNGNNVWTSTAPRTASTTTETDATYNIYGDGIPVFWQSSDLKLFAQATMTTTGTSTTPTTTTSSTPTSSTTSPPTSTPTPSSGLSSGAKIGIGVGIPLAIIALGIVGFLLWMRRRRGTRLPQEDTAHHGTPLTDYKGAYAPQQQPSNSYTGQRPTEIDGNGRAVSELYSGHEAYDPHRPRGHYELGS